MAAGRRVLILCDDDRAAARTPLQAALGGIAGLEATLSDRPSALLELGGVDAVLVDSTRPLMRNEAEALQRFIAQGGTAVAAAGTLSSWSGEPLLRELAGWTPDGHTVHTELRLRSGDGSATFVADDAVNLLHTVPEHAVVLLGTTYRLTDHVVAYGRPHGEGRFVYLGLGRNPSSYTLPDVVRLLSSTLRRHNGREVSRVGVGLLGFGALGAAHAAALGQIANLELRAVCDISPRRRALAEASGVETVASEAELHARDDVDLVLVGTPPHLHAEAVRSALLAGKHVVCEKPFALHTADCDAAIALAGERGLLLTVYQNRRWDSDFVRLRDTLRSGAIGDVFHLEAFVGGYGHPCNYWHSDETVSGGAAFDWGSHYVDWILQLVATPVRSVRALSHKRMWHDVTNADHVTLEMDFEDGVHASFIHSDLAAAAKPKWFVLGTRGAVLGEWQQHAMTTRGPDGELDVQAALPTDLPAQLSVHRPGPAGVDVERLALPPRDRLGFWRNIAAHLQDGVALAVQPREARDVVAVLEAARSSAANEGALIPVAR